jgi:UDP-GlcNAc:undecaprenyl-phosphate GlcNAc-1-phosphate transferase
VAVLFIVGCCNAVNMLDGVDGLAGGYLALSCFWLALIAQAAGRGDVAVEALVLMAALVGFLVFNLRHRWRARASVFMGDAGSTMLGAVVAYLLVRLASGPGALSFPMLLWLVIVPVTDTLILAVTRIAAGHSPFRPDRRHLHHLLQDRGFTPGQTAALLIAASCLCGAVAYGGLLLAVPDGVIVLGLAAPVALHIGFVTARNRPTAPKAKTPPLAKSLDQTPGNA